MPNDQDKRKVTEELESLQLEETRHRVGQMRSDRAMREVRTRSLEASLKRSAAADEYRHNNCYHRKGGMGVENIFRGNDPNYSVIKNQRADGAIVVICQRCDKLWEPPDPALKRRGATVEERKLYAKLNEEYLTALNYPTDNTMSGSQLFVITREQPEQAIAV
jgi:hypothetical protein